MGTGEGLAVGANDGGGLGLGVVEGKGSTVGKLGAGVGECVISTALGVGIGSHVSTQSGA